MRADVSAYTLVREPTLAATLHLLAQGTHTPLAGGTELMVALSAGRLPARALVSIAHLQELRFIDPQPMAITIGGGTTFTDLRRSPEIAAAFPLLSFAASWTGSVANQNRATVAGNLCNASPAADSAPPLLLYEAEVALLSAAGLRTLPLSDFFLAYKRTALRPDELLFSIRIPRTPPGYTGSLHKVGTRNAQAISKVALGTLISLRDGRVEDARVAAASLGPVPMRLRLTEQTLRSQPIDGPVLQQARAAIAQEARPIDDIRSTGRYRTAVSANLLVAALQAAKANSTSVLQE